MATAGRGKGLATFELASDPLASESGPPATVVDTIRARRRAKRLPPKAVRSALGARRLTRSSSGIPSRPGRFGRRLPLCDARVARGRRDPRLCSRRNMDEHFAAHPNAIDMRTTPCRSFHDRLACHSGLKPAPSCCSARVCSPRDQHRIDEYSVVLSGGRCDGEYFNAAHSPIVWALRVIAAAGRAWRLGRAARK